MIRMTLVAFAAVALASSAHASTALTGTLSGDTRYVTGTTGEHATPWGLSQTDEYLTTTTSGQLLFDNLSAAATSISFLWGSEDNYNTLTVIGIDDSVLQTIVGNGNGDQGPAGTSYKTIYFTPGTVKGFGFDSGGIHAFETGAAFVSDVPEPATWALMLGGFAMVGVGTRLRSKALVA